MAKQDESGETAPAEAVPAGNVRASEDRATRKLVGLDSVTQRTLGQLLRAHFSELIEAPIPDRITQLFSELERKETTRESQQAGKTR
jgi:hypothetical protein